MTLFFFFGLELKLSWCFCQAETETPFRNPGSATVLFCMMNNMKRGHIALKVCIVERL